ncbi:sulfite exporter TauE/SafE family protein [Saccharobesus litoralis]|uniref:Probable membrane transporter protein n=1 Tax=Saccharobesus litoralis TaxID=2172099 RepID=A0A2S0VQR1_9ALTE|nr:sulfite exporter TauE/SafE family protein [Saccharobesus litoralis]AWB66553.1 sulfite exporter TauE/SafE family protein [Saccharobesus litoralis]
MKPPHKIKHMPLGLNRSHVLAVFFILWTITLSSIPDNLAVISDYFSFFFLGILGALFANATGAGGGVVFIPMFNQLGFTDIQAVATSFSIQCFGMTAGALAWFRSYQKETQPLATWQSFWPIIMVTSLTSILGLWTAYLSNIHAPAALHESFSLFSIALGIGILVSVYVAHQGKPREKAPFIDLIALALIGYFGGLITAWLSVGVGELMAIYLIIRRYEVAFAVATAVLVSAFTVWASTVQHWLIDPQYYWQVILFAGPGALLGGVAGRKVVSYLPARRLKIFFALWILIVGISTSGIPDLIKSWWQ